MNSIKEKGKANKKDISKDEAEKILKQSQNQEQELDMKNKKIEKKPTKKVEAKKSSVKKLRPKPTKTKAPLKKIKKVSKK